LGHLDHGVVGIAKGEDYLTPTVLKGAVSIVEDALSELDKKKLADVLDPERKAAMIPNLLVVLVGDREVTPVINTGILYS
jgi:hypothetical protein